MIKMETLILACRVNYKSYYPLLNSGKKIDLDLAEIYIRTYPKSTAKFEAQCDLQVRHNKEPSVLKCHRWMPNIGLTKRHW